MGIPRTMPDLHGGDGVDVLEGRARVRDEHGADLTDAMIAGAEAMLSFARSERMAKWNEGLRIGEALAEGFALPPRSSFPWG